MRSSAIMMCVIEAFFPSLLIFRAKERKDSLGVAAKIFVDTGCSFCTGK